MVEAAAGRDHRALRVRKVLRVHKVLPAIRVSKALRVHKVLPALRGRVVHRVLRVHKVLAVLKVLPVRRVLAVHKARQEPRVHRSIAAAGNRRPQPASSGTISSM